MRVDLSCDAGEGMGDDAALVDLCTSVNVACGFHAGDPATMRRTVALARVRGAALGAHPGFPDREGMGRREMGLAPDEIRDLVTYQIGALDGFVRAAGARLHHVKLHGALYNMAARVAEIAEAAAGAVAAVDETLIFVGLPGTGHEAVAARARLRFVAEVFADRTYGPDGHLTPRGAPGAFVTDPAQAIRRLLGVLREGRIESTAGTAVAVRADTVCIHGDNPAALEFARAIVDGLRAAGVELRAVD